MAFFSSNVDILSLEQLHLFPFADVKVVPIQDWSIKFPFIAEMVEFVSDENRKLTISDL